MKFTYNTIKIFRRMNSVSRQMKRKIKYIKNLEKIKTRSEIDKLHFDNLLNSIKGKVIKYKIVMDYDDVDEFGPKEYIYYLTLLRIEDDKLYVDHYNRSYCAGYKDAYPYELSRSYKIETIDIFNNECELIDQIKDWKSLA